MSDTGHPKLADLLHLIDRAEKGAALPDEYRLLRDGVGAMARSAARERMAWSHAHSADADRAEMRAQVAAVKASVLDAQARETRGYARGYAAALRPEPAERLQGPPGASEPDPAAARKLTCPENALSGP